MKYLTPALLAAVIALSVSPLRAATGQGPDIQANTPLTMKECLAMQAAKHDGASRGAIREACQWSTEQSDVASSLRTNNPHALDPYPYGVLRHLE